MKRSTAIMVLAVLIPAAQAFAGANDLRDLFRGSGVIVDHPPLNTGGLASDTLLIDMFGNEIWQRVADDFVLGGAATIRRVNWWGFYHLDNPPATETMRIRFYGARASDGLPDDNNVLFEESFLDPQRTATGRTVFTGVDPDEYIYQVDLTTPITLAATTPYWLEIVQVGDVDTHFRWEFSGPAPIGLAFVNPGVPDWQETTFSADNAYELSTVPEPSALGFFICGSLFLRRRGVTERRP